MAINRFTQRKIYNTFNPLSIQELSILPGAKQAQHDQAMANAEAQKLAIQSMAKDSADAQRLTKQMDADVSSFTSNLMEKGVSPNTTRDLMALKSKREGVLNDKARIEGNLAAFTQYEKELKDRFTKGNINRREYERALKSSLANYRGYKEGNFSGYTPTDYVNVGKLSREIGAQVKKEVMTRGGWAPTGETNEAGESIWVKNGETTTLTPKGTDDMIQQAILSDPRIQEMIKDEVFFDQSLNFNEDAESGSIIYDGQYYNPEKALEASAIKAQNNILSQAQQGIGIAYSGQGIKNTQDIKFVNSGVNKGFNKNNVGLNEDIGGSTQKYSGMTTSDLHNKSIEYSKGVNPGDLAEAQNIKNYLTNARAQYNETADGKAIKEFYKNNNFTMTEKELQKATSQVPKLFGGRNLIPSKELASKYNKKQLEEIEKYAKAYSEGIDGSNGFNDFLESGQVSSGKSFKINAFDDKSRSNLNNTVKSNLDSNNFEIVGAEAGTPTEDIMNEIVNSGNFNVRSLNTSGVGKPTLTVSYTDSEGEPQTNNIVLKGLRTGNIPNSVENIIDYLTVDDPDLNREFKSEIQYSEVPVGDDMNLTENADLFPNLGISYNKVTLSRLPDGRYKIYAEDKNGKVVSDDQDIVNSKGIGLDVLAQKDFDIASNNKTR